jgi:3,4-dihydroxy 2-butanone 4-phosphate synthase
LCICRLIGDDITKLTQALTDLQNGKFVLVYDNDDREGEADLVMASQFVTPRAIRQMRKDGGGLIFIMTSFQMAQKLQLPFLSDLYENIHEQYPIVRELTPNDLLYDTKSSFSLYINHRDTFTGITDKDRSFTMKKFASLLESTRDVSTGKAMKLFGSEFRSPGHIPICIAAPKLLEERKGHTELVVSLLKMSGLIPAGSGCEMMGDNDNALTKTDAEKYAKTHGYVFLTAEEVEKAWQTWSP